MKESVGLYYKETHSGSECWDGEWRVLYFIFECFI